MGIRPLAKSFSLKACQPDATCSSVFETRQREHMGGFAGLGATGVGEEGVVFSAADDCASDM